MSTALTLAQQLQQTLNSKNGIKQAINDKGVEVTDQPFSEYAALVDSVDTAQNCPVAEGEEILPYVWADHRPAEWLALPPNENGVQKISCLFAIFENSTRAGWVSIAGDYTVDWGDGNIENFASGDPASHDYDYSDANLTDTVDTLGYKQILVTITPQAGEHFTSVKMGSNYATSVKASEVGHLLETYINGENINTIHLGGNALPRRETVSIEVGEHAITDAGAMCSGASNLKNLLMDFTDVEIVSGICSRCDALEYLNINSPLITTLSTAVYACYSLKRVDFESKLVSNYYYAFRWCHQLEAVNSSQKGVFNLDSSNAVLTHMDYALEKTQAETVNILNLPSDASVRMSSAFSLMPKFKQLNIQNTIKSNTFVTTFYACYALEQAEFNLEMLPSCACVNLFKLTPLEKIPAWFDFINAGDMQAALEETRITRTPSFSNSHWLNMRRFAKGVTTLHTIGAINISGSGAGDWRELVQNSSNLVNIGAIDVSKWQLYNATDFANLTKLSKVDLFNIDRSISFANANLSATEINKIFGNLVEATGQTITITGCTGANECDTSIATAKGWTVAR